MIDQVVVTGMGMVCSLGHSVSEVWRALLEGKGGIGPIKGFDAGGFDCRVAAQVRGLGPSELGIHTRDARIMDIHSFMLVKCAHDALVQARLDKASIPREAIGFFVGMGMVDYDVKDLLPSVLKALDSEGAIDYDKFYSGGYREIYPLWSLSMLNNITLCQIAISLDIRGENTVFSPHADSGAQAIAEGVETILEKKARVVLAGGVSEKVSPLSLARAHLSNMLNTSDDPKEMRCRPFSSRRKGTILGEGCGILALELRSSADRRGVAYEAVIGGYGNSCEINEEKSGPTVRAVSYAMKEAMAKAEIEPSGIDLIIAHGDGTYSGNRNETEAIHQVFSKCLDRVYVFSSKGALGDLLAGSPALDTILAICMIESGMVPRTLNSDPKESGTGFNVFGDRPLRASPKMVMINSRSYEGQCSSLIIEACA